MAANTVTSSSYINPSTLIGTRPSMSDATTRAAVCVLRSNCARKECGPVRNWSRVGVAGTNAAKGKELHGLLVGKWGFYIVLESNLIGRRVRGHSTVLPSEATRNQRSFEKERQRTARQREWTAKHPLPCQGRSVDGEWDQFPGVSIEQHGGGRLLPEQKIPQSSPHSRCAFCSPSKAVRD